MHWQHPSFFAFFPSASTFESLLGDLYAGCASNPGFNVCHSASIVLTFFYVYSQWSCSPACTELEALVMDWAAQLLGLSSVFLTTTGVGGGVIMVCFLVI